VGYFVWSILQLITAQHVIVVLYLYCIPGSEMPWYHQLHLHCLALMGAMLMVRADQSTPLACIAETGVPADAVPVLVTFPATTDFDRASACAVSPFTDSGSADCARVTISITVLEHALNWTLMAHQTACGAAGRLYSFFTNTGSDFTCTCSFTSAPSASVVLAANTIGDCSTMTTWVSEQVPDVCNPRAELTAFASSSGSLLRLSSSPSRESDLVLFSVHRILRCLP
jgi:hypothetical protein